jgi:hypothetical protein
VYQTLTVQSQKFDQPNGRALGTMYTRGLVVFSSLIDTMCITISWAYLFPLRPSGLMGFHHAEFHEALLNRLPSCCRTSPSKRLESYVQRPGTRLCCASKMGPLQHVIFFSDRTASRAPFRKTMLQGATLWATFQHRNTDARAAQSERAALQRYLLLQGTHTGGEAVKHLPSA